MPRKQVEKMTAKEVMEWCKREVKRLDRSIEHAKRENRRQNKIGFKP